MSDSNEYTPPRVWHWDSENGGRFANINRPTAGASSKKNCRLESTPCNFIPWEHLTASRPP